MGFSYKDWSGVFYPAELAARNYLSYYSRVFNAAEIDSTFYGTPKAETVERWYATTPDEFQFCVKVPRAITHDLGLVVGAWGLMEEFIRTMRLLQEKLGVILFQFPPSFSAEQFPILDQFLSDLPTENRFAVEIRDPSWYTAAVDTAGMLSSHGVCWAATEYPGLPRQVHRTAPYLYIRWIGRHGSFEHHTHERIDRTKELTAWWELLQPELDSLDAIYGFFNNDFAGYAPGSADRFKTLAGLPRQPMQPPQQGTLF